eukprot:scaffold76615_cov20-Tisochrysis_lutea.AAC.1
MVVRSPQVAPSGGSAADHRISAAPTWLLLAQNGSSSSSSSSNSGSSFIPTAVAPPEYAGSGFGPLLVLVVSSSGLLTLIHVCHHAGMLGTSHVQLGQANCIGDKPCAEDSAAAAGMGAGGASHAGSASTQGIGVYAGWHEAAGEGMQTQADAGAGAGAGVGSIFRGDARIVGRTTLPSEG